MSKSNIEALCDYLQKNKAEFYPIKNEMLDSETDFILNGYMKMLAVILQQADEIQEAQIAIYKRLLAGVKTDKLAEDYLRMALEITVEDYFSFSAEMKDLMVRYRFILDALVLTCLSPKNYDQIKLVAEFVEAVNVTKDELRYISTMAKAIVCMDMSMYVDACELEFDVVLQEVFYGYTKLLVEKCVLYNDRMTIFQPSCVEDVTVEKLEEINNIKSPILKLNNIRLNASEYPLVISNRKRVVLENCSFVGGNKNSITFFQCEEVKIINCEFKDFTSYTIFIEFVKDLVIRGTNFSNCFYTYNNSRNDWSTLGGVIHVGKCHDLETSENILKPMVIDNCCFNDCGGKNKAYYFRKAFLTNFACYVNNSVFTNCWHYCCTNGKYNIDPEDSRRTMFTSDSKATNCKYINSAKFC